jgi:putative hydrolase of the HAD superfamily
VSQSIIWDDLLAKAYINLDVIEFVRSVRQDLVTCILSNCTEEGKIKIQEDIGQDHPFDFILSSSDFGAQKPAPEAYAGMLDTIGIKAEDCIFFDDRTANVEGAKFVGIQAYLFEDVGQLMRLVVPT